MDREEILAKSRMENKNKDIYEQEVSKQASNYAVVVQGLLAIVFFMVQLLVGKGINCGIYALVLSLNATTYWVKYIKLRRKFELVFAIIYTVLVFVMSGFHIYNLIASSTLM